MMHQASLLTQTCVAILKCDNSGRLRANSTMSPHSADNAPTSDRFAQAWLVICQDIPDSGDLRRRYLRAHLAYIESVMSQIAVAGPLSESVGARLSGSCFIYHADDLAAAKALLHSDPYYQAGLFETAEFLAFRPAAGVWIGGATW